MSLCQYVYMPVYDVDIRQTLIQYLYVIIHTLIVYSHRFPSPAQGRDGGSMG